MTSGGGPRMQVGLDGQLSPPLDGHALFQRTCSKHAFEKNAAIDLE